MSRQSSAWTKQARTFRSACQQADAPCYLCGRPIDYTLSGRTPGGFSADHLEPIANGGVLLPGFAGLAPTHLRCNSKRGAGRTIDTSAWGW